MKLTFILCWLSVGLAVVPLAAQTNVGGSWNFDRGVSVGGPCPAGAPPGSICWIGKAYQSGVEFKANSAWTDDGSTLSPPAGRNVAIGTTVLPGTAIATTSATTVNLVAGNNGQQIAFSAGTDVTLNLSSTVAVQGFSVLIIQRGAGVVIPTAGSGVTIRQRQGYTKTAGQYAVATLSCDVAADCILAGDLQ